MTDSDNPNPVEQRAEALYAARSAMADTSPSTRIFGIAEIVRFLNDSRSALSMEQQRTLFASRQLRADFQRLKTQVTLAEMPALAAASAGSIKTRRFDGGAVSVHPSRLPGQSYVVLRFNEPTAPPGTMLLEGDTGEIIKRALPPADPNGEIMLVLDEINPVDADFLRLISDPNATGSFLQ